MPYIDANRRDHITPGSWTIDLLELQTAGELNYAMSLLANAYVKNKGLSYQTIAEIGAAFTYGNLEFYRIVAVPYENAKMAENGPVYGPFQAKR